MTIDDTAILRVRKLRTEYLTRQGIVRAVRDVSFDVRRGEKTGIVGESGSGKSAMALSILGLVPRPGRIASGHIWLNDIELTALSEHEMQSVRGNRISLIFQDPMTSLDPVMTIGKQIMEVILKHRRDVGKREAKDRAIEILRDVEVPLAERRIDDYPHQLSGGMRQRVMIAIALANDPDLVIADEPTTSLDVTTQAQVLDVFERMVEERGSTVILITHNLGVVAEFCDSVKVMYAGRIVEEASTAVLFQRPIHPYTEALLKSVPDPAARTTGRLPSIPGAPPNLLEMMPGCSFEPRCPVGQNVDICRETDPQATEMRSGEMWAIAACHFAHERWQSENDTSKEPPQQ